ncbi:hypothetical protein pb186bvf_020994 [Paramecium bursaria]
MEWQKDIWLQGKQVQLYRFMDICPIKVVKSVDHKICCINSQQVLRMFNLENLQIEKQINLSEIMAENLFRFYQPLYLSEQYLFNQGYILNTTTEQKYFIEYDYTLDYIDEERIYGYRIIKKNDFSLCLQVVELDNFGQIIQKIYEEDTFQSDNFLIDKYFIVVQLSQWLKIFLTKKQSKFRFRIKVSNFKLQIISLKNNQLMFIQERSHHTIKLASQLKLVRRISKFPDFIAVIGSLCIGTQTCNKSQVKLFYYDYVSFQQGLIDEAFVQGNLTCTWNSRYFSFTLGSYLNVLKFK